MLEPPRVAPFSLPTGLSTGARVAVQCVLSHGDPPVRLTWLKDGQMATSLAGVSVTPLGQYVLALVIEKVSPQHAGNYTCKASRHAENYTCKDSSQHGDPCRARGGSTGGSLIEATHSSLLIVHGTYILSVHVFIYLAMLIIFVFLAVEYNDY